MKHATLLLIVLLLPVTGLRGGDPAQVVTDNWFDSDEKVKVLTEICDNTLKALEKYNEPLGKAQEQFPIMSEMRTYVGEAWIKNRHLAAALAILSDELHFLPKLSGQQHREFATCLLAASFNLDTIREDAENDVESLIQFGQMPSEIKNLMGLRDAVKDARRLARRLKNLPPDEK